MSGPMPWDDLEGARVQQIADQQAEIAHLETSRHPEAGMSSHDPTPSLAEFAEMEKVDSNAWWRLGSGDHLNLYEDAIELIEDLRAEIKELRGE